MPVVDKSDVGATLDGRSRRRPPGSAWPFEPADHFFGYFACYGAFATEYFRPRQCAVTTFWLPGRARVQERPDERAVIFLIYAAAGANRTCFRGDFTV